MLSLYYKNKRGSSCEDDIQRVDDPGEVTENGQKHVEPELVVAANFKEHPERRENDGKDDLRNI